MCVLRNVSKLVVNVLPREGPDQPGPAVLEVPVNSKSETSTVGVGPRTVPVEGLGVSYLLVGPVPPKTSLRFLQYRRTEGERDVGVLLQMSQKGIRPGLGR